MCPFSLWDCEASMKDDTTPKTNSGSQSHKLFLAMVPTLVFLPENSLPHIFQDRQQTSDLLFQAEDQRSACNS